MNTGLQDAANLGWKLAAVVRGWAGDGLLDSYHVERYPIGRMVLRLSGGLLRLALLEQGPLRAARRLIVGTALRLRPVADAAARLISGIGISYPGGPGAHPLTGRRAPDLPLIGEDQRVGRLYEALRSGRFVLLVASTEAGFGDAAYGDSLCPVGEWRERVDRATPASATPPLVLVRPDGYVAWASDEADAATPSPDGLFRAGTPA